MAYDRAAVALRGSKARLNFGGGGGCGRARDGAPAYHPRVPLQARCQLFGGGLDVGRPSPWPHVVCFPPSMLHQAAPPPAGQPLLAADVAASQPSTALELRTGPRALPFDLNEPPSNGS